MMEIRIATENDAASMLEIYRPYIEGSAVSFELETPTLEDFKLRVKDTLVEYPWYVAVENEEVIGYGYAGRHRARKAYQWYVETAIYVKASGQRKGVARKLYEKLLSTLTELGFLGAYAIITLPNEKSVGFHEALGFKPLCVYPKAGFKLGQWHDVGWWRVEVNQAAAYPIEPIAFSKLKVTK